MKTKNLWKYTITAFLVSLLGCAFFFYNQKKTYTSLSHSANKLIEQKNEKLASIVTAYKKKYQWLNSFYFNKAQDIKSKKNAEIFQILKQLETTQIKAQADLNKFELINIKLNQLLITEVVKLNSNQQSMFSSQSQIRDLERYDRHIDFTRTQYSLWSYEYYQTTNEIKKNFFAKNNSLTEIPFYEIDHLIFRNKKEKKVL